MGHSRRAWAPPLYNLRSLFHTTNLNRQFSTSRRRSCIMQILQTIVLIVSVKCFLVECVEPVGSSLRTSRWQRSIKPKLSICCPPNTFMTSASHTSCSSNTSIIVSDPEIPQVYTKDLRRSEAGPEGFQKIYGIPCKHGIYELTTDSDVFYLLEDGRFFLDNSLHQVPDAYMDTDSYCITSWMGDNGTFTRIIACYPEQSPGIPVTYTISIVLSMPFLVITFCVYGFLPELRNIHGKTLMAYVASLFWGYVGLVVVQFGVAGPWHLKGLCTLTGKLFEDFLKGKG